MRAPSWMMPRDSRHPKLVRKILGGFQERRRQLPFRRREPGASGIDRPFEHLHRFVEPAEPGELSPASEATDAWVLLDDDHLYFVARLHDSAPESMVANEMRPDHFNIGRGESCQAHQAASVLKGESER